MTQSYYDKDYFAEALRNILEAWEYDPIALLDAFCDVVEEEGLDCVTSVLKEIAKDLHGNVSGEYWGEPRGVKIVVTTDKPGVEK